MNLGSLSLLLAIGCAANAATITSFTASYQESGFTHTALTASFSGGTAKITNTQVQCPSTGACPLDRVLFFEIIGTGYDPSQSIGVTLDGTLSGTAAATGTIYFAPRANLSLILATSNFSFAAGAFNTTLISPTALPFTGNFDVLGYLSMALAAGQVLDLPGSLNINIATTSAVPEPSSMALIGTGLAAAIISRRRRGRG